MAPSRARRPRRSGRVVVAAGLLLALTAGCSSPQTGSGTLAEAKTRIVDLVNETGAAIGAPITLPAVKSAAPVPCRKHFLGYTISRLSTHRAEATVPVPFKGKQNGASLLPRVERYWRSKGYTIDRSGMSDHHYPKLRAHVGRDLLVATGYAKLPEINLYGVTACVRS
jgi:hypothetical protein